MSFWWGSTLFVDKLTKFIIRTTTTNLVIHYQKNQTGKLKNRERAKTKIYDLNFVFNPNESSGYKHRKHVYTVYIIHRIRRTLILKFEKK